MRTLLTLSAGLLAAVGVPAAADDPDPVGAKLGQARVAYTAKVEVLRAGVLAALQEKEDAARLKSDAKTVERVKAEREAFATRNTTPTVVDTAGYARELKAARAAFAAELRAAVKGYLDPRVRKDAAAAAAQKELDALLAEADPPADPGGPGFTKGSVWKGLFQDNGSAKRDAVLEVTELKDGKFEATVRLPNEGVEARVAGRVTWKAARAEVVWDVAEMVTGTRPKEFTNPFRGTVDKESLAAKTTYRGNGGKTRTAEFHLAPPTKK